MLFADTYFKRFRSNEQIISEEPDKDLFITVVIPAYNEPDLINSLTSLLECDLPNHSAEVIVVLNSHADSSDEILNTNRRSYWDLMRFSEEHNSNKLKFYIISVENLPKKFAGVGLARKIGMDEALRRFNKLNKPNGLIVGFDADATVKKNYFVEIESYFKAFPKTNAASIYFEHPLQGTGFTDDIYRKIISYELHLRYYIEALRYINFPFAYHTIGSSFVVRAEIYAKQGGMNRKKAGEDFYFLQKIIPLGNFGEINSTCVYPSPRISDRVPFGTGAAIKEMREANSDDFTTYDIEIFNILNRFLEKKDDLFSKDLIDIGDNVMSNFLLKNNFWDDLKEIKRNSPNIEIFRKRFYQATCEKRGNKAFKFVKCFF